MYVIHILIGVEKVIKGIGTFCTVGYMRSGNGIFPVKTSMHYYSGV